MYICKPLNKNLSTEVILDYMNVNSLLFRFNTVLCLNEVPLFRGAILKCIRDDTHLLFHNHVDDDHFRYGYPKVQYKSLSMHAGILCLAEGVDEMERLMKVFDKTMWIGQRKVLLDGGQAWTQETDVEIGDKAFYRITDWLPLNGENNDAFFRLQTDEQRFDILQRILVGNILSFAKGFSIFFTEQVQCEIQSIDGFRMIECKSVWMKSFDVVFSCNVRLPDFIGLGKHASFGCGVVTHLG